MDGGGKSDAGPAPGAPRPVAAESPVAPNTPVAPVGLGDPPSIWDRGAWAVLGTMLVLLLHGAWRVGPTVDEHFYAASGRLYWTEGDFALNREHPPLVKLLAGLPLVLAPGIEADEHDRDRINYPASFFYQRNAEDLDRNLFLARLPICLVTLGAAFALHRFARRAFGPRAALVGLSLFALNPNVLAHGCLAALDSGLMAFALLAVLGVLRMLEEPKGTTVLGAGVALGLANLAKFTALLLGPFTLVLALLAAWRARSPRPLGAAALALLCALSVFAAGYGFEAKSLNEAWGDARYVTEVRDPETGASEKRIFTQGWIDTLVRGTFGEARPVPLLTAFKGVDYQAEHAAEGHDTVFRGRVYGKADFAAGNPVPSYYLTVLGVKNPVAALVLFVLGLALCWRAGPGWSLLRGAALAGFPLLLLFVFSTSNALLGVKYVLPVFPFLALLGARVATVFPRAALALAAVALLESLWIHPHELMYYNLPAGGPSGGPAITVVGDDWGQGVRALGRFHAEHEAEIEAMGGLTYEPYTAGDLAAFGLGDAKPARGAVSGLLAVHLVHYHRQRQKYAALDGVEPFAVLDRSVLLFNLPSGEPPPWFP